MKKREDGMTQQELINRMNYLENNYGALTLNGLRFHTKAIAKEYNDLYVEYMLLFYMDEEMKNLIPHTHRYAK